MSSTVLEGLTAPERALVEAVAARAAGNVGDDAVLAAAAKLLGSPVREVAGVTDTPAGVLISVPTATDPAEGLYLLVPPDRPDGEGKTGLMTTRPVGHMQVYARPTRGTIPAASRAPVSEVGDIDTVQAAIDRQGQIEERLQDIAHGVAVATSITVLEELEAERTKLERELQILGNRLPLLTRNQARQAQETERQAEATSARALRRCYVDADPILGRIRGLIDELAAVRQRALEAGADVELVGTAAQVDDPSRTNPRQGHHHPGFRLVDQLGHYLDSQWPDLVATSRKLLEEDPEPVRATEGRRRR